MLMLPFSARRFNFILLVLFCTGLATSANAAAGNIKADERDLLAASFLLGTKDMRKPVATHAFGAPMTRRLPRNRFTGRLELTPDSSRMHARAIRDEDRRLRNREFSIQNLPFLSVEFVQDGNSIIPAQRGPQASPHAYWEWVLEPGKVWDEAGDSGYSRAVIPFSLQQRNQNCMHHGMLTFLFRSDGEISRMAYQVVSETCIWLNVDLWGVQNVTYTPGEVENADELIARHRQDIANRLPVKSIVALSKDYPGIDAGNFTPQSPEHATIWGLLSDNVHYVGGCQTRYGPHPFCEVLDLPSYSTAKAVFAGLVYAHLEQRYPGLGTEKVTDWIPECVVDDDRWRDVELRHLINMSTGLYNSGKYMKDEDRITHKEFIQGDTHSQKVNFACREYRRQRQPGEHWVYHTSDTYLAGLLMNRYLKQKSGTEKDLFTDLLVTRFWNMLGLSTVTGYTRRTYDDVAQPFTGYGLTFHPDDIIRIAQWLNKKPDAMEASEQLDPETFGAIMQRPARTAIPPLDTMGLDYRYGFWAAEASTWVGCKEPVWLPFMSGFGGITVVLLPNDMVYYYFSDSGIFLWSKAVIEAHKIRPICNA